MSGGPPGFRLPEILGPWETAVALWRRLRRMSTALLLLFLVAIASVIGTFVPQEPVIATTVADWRAGSAGPGAGAARVLDAAGFFDVFGSWWFLGIVALLFVSLTGCLVPRISAFARTARRPPPAGRNLDRLSNRAVLSARGTAETMDAVEAELRRRRFRVRRLTGAGGQAQIAAEKGHWREGGSLVFHCAFYLLLVGVVVAQGFGFSGQVNVVEGDEPIVDTRLTYGLASPGRWFGLEDHRGFAVRLDEFSVDYHENDTPADYRSDISILENDTAVTSGSVRVNHPFRYDGMNIYQVRFGMAPHIVVRAGDQVVFDDRVALAQGPGGVWTGVAKVSTRPGSQMALDIAFLPDADVVEGPDGALQFITRSPRPENPRVFADLYIGELGLERPGPASELDRSGGAAVSQIILAPGMPQPVADGRLTVEFADTNGVGEWTGFQISHQPGRPILVAAAVLILAGLVPSLYSYRRRVWAEVREEDGRPVVLVAGVALQRASPFADEFGAMTAAMTGRLQRRGTDRQPAARS